MQNISKHFHGQFEIKAKLKLLDDTSKGSDLPCKDGIVQFTTVPSKPLTDLFNSDHSYIFYYSRNAHVFFVLYLVFEIINIDIYN